MDDLYALTCWIRGESPDDVFDVEISPEKKVLVLKERIKERYGRKFKDIVAQDLRLYKLKDPVDEDGFCTVTPSSLGELLSNRKKLSQVFTEQPLEDHIHLIVDYPFYTLTCWIRCEDPSNHFPIKISLTEGVLALKDKIKKERSITLFKDVEAGLLRLYKLKDPVDEHSLNTVTLSSSGELLSNWKKLSQVFTEQPPEDHIHIIVDYPYIFYYIRGATYMDGDVRITGSARLSKLGEHVVEKDPSISKALLEFHRGPESNEELRKALDVLPAGKCLDLNEPISTIFLDVPVLANTCIIINVVETSGSSEPSSFHPRQADKATPMLCDCSRETQEPIPMSLLHEVFGKFVDDCRNYKLTAEDNCCGEDLAIIMSNIYDSEASQIDAVVKALQTNYQLGDVLRLGDVCMSVKGNGFHHPYLISEFKNEAAGSHFEPFIQPITHHLIATRDYASKVWWSSLPSLLLVVTGPQIVFVGAGWATRPYAEVLSTPVSLNLHSTDESRRSAIRHMAAFATAISSLRKYYETLPVNDYMPGDTSNIQYPYRRHFMSLDGHRIDFTYNGRLAAAPKKLIFGGIIKEDIPVVIKFVQHYSHEVHVYFADQGVAPKLWGCERLPSDWYLVVMDMLVGSESLAEVRKKQKKIPKEVLDDVETRLKVLHKRRLVHGDIRDTNILVMKNDRTKYMIVNFNQAGKIGEVEYPACVNHNHNGIDRPAEVKVGKPILASHDLYMLDVIRQNIVSQRV